MRTALNGLRLWSATVLINSMIMTVYLWHMSVLAAVIAILYYTGASGLGVEPGSTDWWLLRPVWIGGLLVLLLPFSLVLSPFERRGRSADAPVPGAARQIFGAATLCLGLAVIAMYGYGGGPSPLLSVVALAFVIIGAWLGGLLPRISK